MKNIKINTYGKIIKGEYKNWLIYIQNDKANTGGYLILYKPSKNSEIGYDDWVESYEGLNKYFSESNWEIEWE